MLRHYPTGNPTAGNSVPVIQLWDYVDVQFVDNKRFGDWPTGNDALLDLSPGVRMTNGYVHRSKQAPDAGGSGRPPPPAAAAAGPTTRQAKRSGWPAGSAPGG
jgi:hypothetical protein